MAKFKLDSSFIAGYRGKQPKWGPVGYVTYKRTYARPLTSLRPNHAELARAAGLVGSEEFWLTLVRVTEGCFGVQEDHCASLHLPWDAKVAQRKAQEMYRLMWEFKFSPPGRGLWMMGAPSTDKLGGSALNNCGFVSTKDLAADFSGPFCFLMDFSMLGVGVGFDVLGAQKIRIKEPVESYETYVVADTREGWVDLLRVTLDAFVGRGALHRTIDASGVRKAGALINGFGGTASGPAPLLEMRDAIVALLRSRVGHYVSVSDITDVMNLVGRCVVSGNVRRSAEIGLGEDTDEYLDLKDKDKHPKAVDGWRWASNNSVLADIGQSYRRAAQRTAKNGEPGYEWLENARRYGRMADPPDDRDAEVVGVNPCAEQSLHDRELCNLVETYPAHHDTVEEYLRTLKYAYLYAKTVTLMPTHDQRVNAVTMKNRRIGCSMSGIAQAVAKFGYRGFLQLCDSGYAEVQSLDKTYSNWLCVPRSIKTTSVKPSGTVSLLCGATPGIHFPESEFYWRVIRFASDSPMLPALRRAGYQCVEIAPEKEPNTTAVYFPVHEVNFRRAKGDVSMWEQLLLAADVQAHWADNQVSATVTFDKKTEGPQIERALEVFETRLKGVSFLPREDHGYEHTPYQPITEAQYDVAVAALSPLDLAGGSHEVTDSFCDGDKCLLPVPRS